MLNLIRVKNSVYYNRPFSFGLNKITCQGQTGTQSQSQKKTNKQTLHTFYFVAEQINQPSKISQ